jgi:hypothetical protein
MSSQPVSGDQWKVVSGGVGTAAVTNKPATIKRLVWGGSYVGTLNIHDATGAAGTTATSQIVSLGIPLLRFPYSLELNTRVRNGITYQATGTPVVTIVWD